MVTDLFLYENQTENYDFYTKNHVYVNQVTMGCNMFSTEETENVSGRLVTQADITFQNFM